MKGFEYVIRLDRGEYRTLCWLSERYVCAETLWSCASEDDEGYEDDEGGATLHIPEHVAWRYLDELIDENGNPNQLVPPCAGGTLQDKLVDFYDSIV